MPPAKNGGYTCKGRFYGYRLANAREMRGLSVDELADVTGVPAHIIRHCEKYPGAVLTDKHIKSLCAALGIVPEYITIEAPWSRPKTSMSKE